MLSTPSMSSTHKCQVPVLMKHIVLIYYIIWHPSVEMTEIETMLRNIAVYRRSAGIRSELFSTLGVFSFFQASLYKLIYLILGKLNIPCYPSAEENFLDRVLILRERTRQCSSSDIGPGFVGAPRESVQIYRKTKPTCFSRRVK